MKRILIFMIFAAIMMATSAQAAQGKLYVAGNIGLSIATSIDDDTGFEITFDPGWNITGAVGYDMGMIRVEGEIAYRMLDIDEVTVPGLGTFSVDGDVSAISFMANGYYDHDMGSPLTPYVGLGLGFVDADIDVSGLGSTGDTEFAYQFMVGAGYEISPVVVLTGGYRYFGIADSESPDIHEFNLGARYMF